MTATQPARHRQHHRALPRRSDNRTVQEVQETISSITSIDLDALRALWRERYGSPPALRSLPILRMLLAWRIQADVHRGLDKETRRTLARTGPTEPEGVHLGIGARLTRNWKGRTIEVVVEEQGFGWEGKLYPSLSAAATAIAGSRWNGPRFFGLRDEEQRHGKG